jgi:NTE family protein
MDDDLALVLSGGGAHAAYQVGFLRCLARYFPNLRIPILTGISAGAINAAFIANYQGTFAECIDDLSSFWQHLSIDHIFKVDTWSLAKNLLHWGIHLLSGGIARTSSPKGLVDTMPLRMMLEEGFAASNNGMIGIRENIRQQKLKAIAVTTTNYATGQTVTWVQGKNIEVWERPDRHSVMTEITVDQIMASTALPILFPAVKIGDSWHGDGGIGQYAPLSPALHLGARRILAVSTRYRPSLEEIRTAAHREGYPSAAHIMDILMSSIFIEHLDQDALGLERVNRLLEHKSIPEDPKLRLVRAFTLRPPLNLSKIAGKYEPDLPRPFRFLTRRFGTHETESFDWLSMVMFDSRYIKTLMDIGEADAKTRIGEISALLT